MRDERELDWRRHQSHEFLAPAPDLAAHVARYWVVRWSYDRPYRQLIVPYPNVHLALQGGRATVSGVSSRHVHRVLDGDGSVFGVAFRPGRFRGFLGAPVRTITDRTVPSMLPPVREPTAAAVEEVLRGCLPEPDPDAELAARVVDTVIARPDIARVGELADETGLSPRGLQRLFAEHVGVGPKWVIRRYRLHEVTQRMAAGTRVDWAALAGELGYADQPHLVRDFTALFGETPTRYAARYHHEISRQRSADEPGST
ncbi:AraC family transcriptional regulator [Saccharothrix obliqua]|uniref:AraC family transcriptional regulator n=1 Tax=Saccharothrix obliqua TaxID=2861747 RepID=UPI001C5D2B12|nr:helix-turn-helix domain-containing protein [Saccharothrix obliqua]MBW4716398.1 helix-turn-helix domain-containing protein [Saccharothrix obliqua]